MKPQDHQPADEKETIETSRFEPDDRQRLVDDGLSHYRGLYTNVEFDAFKQRLKKINAMPAKGNKR